MDAFDVAAGPTLVLDATLAVVAASPAAERLLGMAIAPGTSAAALLCGDSRKRPVADALAAGKTVRATIPLPGNDRRLITVRSIPVSAHHPAESFVLLLEDAGDVGSDVVCFYGMLTRDLQMKQVFRLIERVADDDVTVLIRGESGTGKELVAAALHAASKRRGLFQAINCAALPPGLLEAELFGTVRGSFTGSTRDTPGLIRSAHKGTLFLDEVAEMPLELQAKLLRVLESRQVQPIGGHEAVNVDVRILSATHRSLRSEVEAGRFRADLMYRLRVIPIFLPPLRERRPDIALLAHHLIQELNEKQGRRHIETISPTALAALTACSWPGNVRELKNALQYAVAMGDGPVLTVAELPAEVRSDETWMPTSMTTPSSPPSSTPATTAGVGPERGLIEQVLSEADGNRDAAARALGISRVTLWRWMKEAGIAVRRRRP